MVFTILSDTGTREATREALGAWLEKNEEKPFLRVLAMILTTKQYRKGLERGCMEAIEQGLEQGKTWYSRQQAALEKGEPFDEPPPWDNSTEN